MFPFFPQPVTFNLVDFSSTLSLGSVFLAPAEVIKYAET